MSKKAKNKAMSKLAQTIRFYRNKVTAALPSEFLLTGKKPKRKHVIVEGSLGDDKARMLAGTLMIELFLKLLKKGGKQRRHFFATFCWDDGVIPIASIHLPDLQAMRRKVDKALRKCGLSGIGVFEIVAVRKSKHHPECISAHIHVFGWTDDPDFKPNKTAAALMAKKSFPNSFNAPSVTIRSRKQSASYFTDKNSKMYKHIYGKLHRDQTKKSMAWLAQYMFQAPAFVKNLMPQKKHSDRFIMRSNYKNYSPQLALALDKILNQIQFTEAVFSVGEGKHVSRKWRKKLTKSLRSLS